MWQLSLDDYTSDQARQADREVLQFVLNEYNYAYHSTMGKVPGHMNYSTAVFLINDQVRAVYAIYEPDKADQKSRRYLFKTFNKSLKAGDMVVVPSTIRHQLDIAKVTDVDVSIDLDSATNIDWIVGVVDTEDFLHIISEEKAAIETIKQAQMAEKRDKLAASLKKHREMIKSLPLSRRAKEDADT